MKRFLVVVDMQKDFVDGALGIRHALYKVLLEGGVVL